MPSITRRLRREWTQIWLSGSDHTGEQIKDTKDTGRSGRAFPLFVSSRRRNSCNRIMQNRLNPVRIASTLISFFRLVGGGITLTLSRLALHLKLDYNILPFLFVQTQSLAMANVFRGGNGKKNCTHILYIKYNPPAPKNPRSFWRSLL